MIKNYADLAEATFADALSTAKDLQKAIDAFSPSLTRRP